MPTRRSFSAAVHVPNMGVLILGGVNGWLGDNLTAVEILRSEEGDLTGEKCTWSAISSMLMPRIMPLAAYHNNRIFVTEMSTTVNFEMLSLSGGQLGQWTRLDVRNQFRDNFKPWSLVNFHGRLLLVGSSSLTIAFI